MPSGLQRFCARDCSIDGCPSLYSCETVNGRKQCVPEGKTCDCVPDTLGLQKSCLGTANQFGACVGNQTCQLDGGFTACNAPAALEETCNGADDNCNGAVDETFPETGEACTTGKPGRCAAGTRVCVSGGLDCTPTTMPSNSRLSNRSCGSTAALVAHWCG